MEDTRAHLVYVRVTGMCPGLKTSTGILFQHKTETIISVHVNETLDHFKSVDFVNVLIVISNIIITVRKRIVRGTGWYHYKS